MTTSTPRRSRRFQPIVAASTSLTDTLSVSWSSEPLKTRPTVRDDLGLSHDEEWAGNTTATTTYYASLTRSLISRAPRTYGRASKGKATAKEVVEVIKLGDTVLVQTSSKKPSVGVVVAMWGVRTDQTANSEGDDQDEVVEVGEQTEEMRLRIHWFTQPSELPRVRANREHLENEVYYSLNSTAVVSPSSIISLCTVGNIPSSKAKLNKAIKPGAYYVSEDEEEREPVTQFVCALALNNLKGLYYTFDWKAHHHRALTISSSTDHINTSEWEMGTAWDVAVETQEKQPIKRSLLKKQRVGKASQEPRAAGNRDQDSDESEGSGDEYQVSNPGVDSDGGSVPATEDEKEDEEGEEENDENPLIPRTPRKRKRQTTAISRMSSTSPRKLATTTPRKRTLAMATPHSKARARRTAAAIVRPPPPLLEQAHDHALAALPPDPWLRAMHVLHVAARPDALPCRDEEYGRVLRAVEELVEEGSGGCVYISGVPGTGKTATVHAVVRELKRMAENNESNPFTYVEINGLRIPEPSAAYALLWEAVSGHDISNEGHLKISPKEALKQLTRHFSAGGRSGPNGHACVVLMDELDQLVTAKQDVVYNFFNWPTLVGSKLVVLAVANTMDLPERVMTGRVRSRLGMIRINFQPYTTPQLEKIVHARLASAKDSLPEDVQAQNVIAPDGIKFAAMKVSSISGDARRVLDICRRAVEMVQPRKKPAKTEDVREVIRVMQNSPTAAYIRELSLHERMMLAALLKCVRRFGIEEIRWGDILTQHLNYASVLTGDDDPPRRPSADDLGLVLDSLLASRALLMEDGGASARRALEDRRCILNLEQAEVERVLGEVGGPRWKTALSS